MVIAQRTDATQAAVLKAADCENMKRAEPTSVRVTSTIVRVWLQDVCQALWLCSPTGHVAVGSGVLVLRADTLLDFLGLSCKNVI